MATASAQPSDQFTSRTDPWRIAWNMVSSDAMLACVLLAIALMLGLAAWLPQAPESATEPIAFSRWRSTSQARFGGTFTPLQEAGLFAIQRSGVLRGLIALAALGLMVRALETVQTAWRARRFQPPPTLAPVQASTELALDDVISLLRQRRFRILREGDAVCADRFPWADAGRLAIYLGALIVIGSLVLSSLMGWRVGNVTLGAGQMLPINAPHGTSYYMRLEALDSDHRSHISLLQETDTIGTGALAPHQPVELAGLTVAIRDTGPAIRASATLTDGQVVNLQASAASEPVRELVLLLTRDDPDRFFAVPQAALVVRLSRGADAPDSIRAQVYRSRTGAVIYDDRIPPDGAVTIEEVNLRLARETYAVLEVIRDPGKLPALAGIAMLGLGLMLAALWPVKQLWAIRGSNGTQLAGDAAAVQTIASGAHSTSAPERPWPTLLSVGWRVGLAILSLAAGGLIVFNLIRGQPLGAGDPAVPAVLAAWLMGCAAALWKQPALRRATLALAGLDLIAAAVLIGLTLPAGLGW